MQNSIFDWLFSSMEEIIDCDYLAETENGFMSDTNKEKITRGEFIEFINK